MKIKDLLTKRPFVRVQPSPIAGEITQDIFSCVADINNLMALNYPQYKFIEEYYPSGHLINSVKYYPNKVKFDEKTGQYFEQQVMRVSLPLQYIITAQQLVHLCGNDIRFELSSATTTDQEKEYLRQLTQGWLDKNMEVAFYHFAKSVKVTGDAAMVLYHHNGKVGVKNLSLLRGDKFYPHYDSITGELKKFAREYSDYDENGKETTSWVEVWDDKYLYRYRRSKNGFKGAINKAKDFLSLDGYALVGEPKSHGFNECPIVYMRDDDGACWSQVQDSIDKLELALSHLCQNNMAYAFPILVLKGSDVNIEGDINGDVKAISISEDNGDAHYLSSPQASEAFKLQIEMLLKMIFLGSFTVMPPEVGSGDLPGVAIKLIYSPSLERAIIDAKEFDGALDKIVRLFKYGYALELGKSSAFENLNVFAWIEPYIHSNTAELISNLTMGVQNGFISKETAATKSTYDENDELARLIKERKQEDMADLIADITPKATTAEEIKPSVYANSNENI